MPPPRRKHPNIAISGVPGTGKTTLAQRLATKYPHFKRIDMGKEAETRECREEYDELLQTWVVDEDKVGTLPHSTAILKYQMPGKHKDGLAFHSITLSLL